jgi:hypothetical protein
MWLYSSSQQALVLPNVGVLVPIVLSEDAAVRDTDRRRVPDVRFGPELQHIVIQARDRYGMFDAGVAVYDHAHIVVIERTAFGYHHHL